MAAPSIITPKVVGTLALLVLASLVCPAQGVGGHVQQNHHRRLRSSFLEQAASTKTVADETDGDSGDDGDDDDDDDTDDSEASSVSTKETKAPQPKDFAKALEDAERAMKIRLWREQIEREKVLNISKEQMEYTRAKFALGSNIKEQAVVRSELAKLDDDKGFQKNVRSKVRTVANETQSLHMAKMLGEMWKEMRMFASPFFKEHLKEKQAKLIQEEKVLQARFNAAKIAKERAEVTGRATGQPEPGMAPAPKATGRKATEGVEFEPMFTAETMPKVSTTMLCIMDLLTLYVIVYTIVMILRTMNQFTGGKWLSWQMVFQNTAQMVTYAPMLCVLLLATRQRAIQLSKGDTDKYDLPQPYVKLGMQAATFAISGQVVLVLVIAVLLGETQRGYFVPFDKAGIDDEINIAQYRAEHRNTATVLIGIRYFLMTLLYLGTVVVIAGSFLMEPPPQVWGQGAQPSVSPPLRCTMVLCVMFFLTYLVSAILHTISQLHKFDEKHIVIKLETLFTNARNVTNLSPMVCVLFTAAKMRALQIDPEHGTVPDYATKCMWACTLAIVLNVIVAVLPPLLDRNMKVKPGPTEGEIIVEGGSKVVKIVGQVLNYLMLLCIYGGACVVAVAIILMKSPSGQTPPVSPAVQCVFILFDLYFFCYTCLVIFQTVLEFKNVKLVGTLVAVFDAGVKTLMFSPMLCLLFLGARLRALQLTRTVDGKVPPNAGPQVWAQEGMALATWSVVWQLLMVLLLPALLGTGANERVDYAGVLEGREAAKYKWKVCGTILTVVNFICLALMYGGALLVVVAIFKMTPETLPPYASQGLIPGVKVPGPPPVPTAPPQFF